MHIEVKFEVHVSVLKILFQCTEKSVEDYITTAVILNCYFNVLTDIVIFVNLIKRYCCIGIQYTLLFIIPHYRDIISSFKTMLNYLDVYLYIKFPNQFTQTFVKCIKKIYAFIENTISII